MVERRQNDFRTINNIIILKNRIPQPTNHGIFILKTLKSDKMNTSIFI